MPESLTLNPWWFSTIHLEYTLRAFFHLYNPMQGQIQENRKGGPDVRKACPLGHAPHPPGNFLHFLFSEVAFSAFSGKNSAQNLINYIKILTAIINSYQSCSNSNDPLNILHECCDTNLLMISFNYMSTKRGEGVRNPWTPPLDLPLPCCSYGAEFVCFRVHNTFNEALLEGSM